jgi:hypothetical protein
MWHTEWATHRRAANTLGEVVVLNCSKLLSSLRLLCIVPVAAAGLIASGPAAVAEPQELKMVERATTDAVTDTGAAGDSAGDILTFANEVFDADDENKIGTDQGICFRTLPGKAWECFWTLSLEWARSGRDRSSTAATRFWRSPAAPANLPAPRARWRSVPSAPTAKPIISPTGSSNDELAEWGYIDEAIVPHGTQAHRPRAADAVQQARREPLALQQTIHDLQTARPLTG